jgi:hypothetical protein
LSFFILYFYIKGGKQLMLCQNCHKNPATIHLYTNVNGQKQTINLCQNCYQLLSNKQGNTGGAQNMAQDPFGFGGLDDIFRAMQGGTLIQPMVNKCHQPNQWDPTMAALIAHKMAVRVEIHCLVSMVST